MPKGKTYPEVVKATVLTALVANGGNVDITSRQHGVPRSTIQRWQRENGPSLPQNEADLERELDPEVVKAATRRAPEIRLGPVARRELLTACVAAAKRSLADHMDETVRFLIGFVPEKAEEADLKEIVNAVAVLSERSLTLRGLPSSIARQENDVGPNARSMADEHLAAELARLDREAEDRAPIRIVQAGDGPAGGAAAGPAGGVEPAAG